MNTLLKSSIILFISSTIVFVPTEHPMPIHPSTINTIAIPKQPISAIPELKTQPQALLAAKVITSPEKPPVDVVRGSCDDWKAQAGIPNTYATNKLINNESGCKWWAVNPKSGACGIAQAYPCSKLGCPLTEAGAVCQLKWMKKYVADVYGTWEQALAKWESRCGSPQGCWY